MRPRRPQWATDRGETLVELLVAVAILGVAGVAILAGLAMSIQGSDLHRKQATGGAYVRSFAEVIQTYVDVNGYQSCSAAASTYGSLTVPDLPTGYTAAVTGVQSWSGSGWGPCAAGANGIQRLDLRVTSTGDAARQAQETLTVIIRRPCNGSAATAGADPCA
jgi:type II secretory pathway pseudopilin PulG